MGVEPIRSYGIWIHLTKEIQLYWSSWPQSSSWKHLHCGRPTRAAQCTQCLHVEIEGWKEEWISSSTSEHRRNIPFDCKDFANILLHQGPLNTSVHKTFRGVLLLSCRQQVRCHSSSLAVGALQISIFSKSGACE